MSRSGEFRGDNRRTDRQTDYFTPAHARGVIKEGVNQCILQFLEFLLTIQSWI